MKNTHNDCIYTYGLHTQYNGLNIKSDAYPNLFLLYKIINNIIKSVALSENGEYQSSSDIEHPNISSAKSVKEAIEYLDNVIKNIAEGSINDINVSLTYNNGIVNLLYNDNIKSSISIPFEQFLDKNETKFVESATSEDVEKDLNVQIGLPYLCLAFKTIDEKNHSSINYSYIPLNKLSDIYVSDDSETLDLSVKDNIISGNVKISEIGNNALHNDKGLFVLDYTNDINEIKIKNEEQDKSITEINEINDEQNILISNNQNEIINIKTDLSNIKDINTQQSNELTEIRNDIQNLENNNTTVTEDITNIESDIDNINTNIGNITSNIDVINNNINDITSDIDNINLSIGDVKNNIEDIENKVNNNLENINNIQEQVNNIPLVDTEDKILTISDRNTIITSISLEYIDDSIILKGNNDFVISSFKLRHPKLIYNIAFDAEKNIINVYYRDNETEETQILDLNGLIIKYNQGNGIIIENNNISVNIDPDSEKYLVLSDKGIKIYGLDEILNNLQTSIDNIKIISDEAKQNAEESKNISLETKDKIDNVEIEITAIENAINSHADTITDILDRLQLVEEELQQNLNSIIYSYEGVSDGNAVVNDNISVEEGYEVVILNRMFKIPDIGKWSPVIGYNDGGDNMLLTAIYKLGISIVVGVSSVERFKNCPYTVYYLKRKI